MFGASIKIIIKKKQEFHKRKILKLHLPFIALNRKMLRVGCVFGRSGQTCPPPPRKKMFDLLAAHFQILSGAR